MALSTYSKFYFGWQITIANQFLDFHDGVSNKTAILTVGYYSATEMVLEIKKQMDAVTSVLDFTVSFDRVTRKITVASTANFTLKITSGVNALQSAFPLLGFVGADKTGSTGYVGDNISGLEYKPQFKLQSYIPTTLNRKAISGAINKSASGKIEVIRFGTERFMTCEFLFITDVLQESGSVIRTNTSAVAEFIQFIEWCTDKGTVEFMENENDPAIFEIFILESTAADEKGLDYELKELFDRGLSGYFNSGSLKFKLIEV